MHRATSKSFISVSFKKKQAMLFGSTLFKVTLKVFCFGQGDLSVTNSKLQKTKVKSEARHGAAGKCLKHVRQRTPPHYAVLCVYLLHEIKEKTSRFVAVTWQNVKTVRD